MIDVHALFNVELRASSFELLRWCPGLSNSLLGCYVGDKSLTKRTSSSGRPTGTWLFHSHTTTSLHQQLRKCVVVGLAERSRGSSRRSSIYLLPNPFPREVLQPTYVRHAQRGVSRYLFGPLSSRCPVSSLPRNVEPFQLQWASQVYKPRTPALPRL